MCGFVVGGLAVGTLKEFSDEQIIFAAVDAGDYFSESGFCFADV